MMAPLEITLVTLALLAILAYAYVRMRRAMQRREREYQVLTQVGQAIRSRLDLDDMLGIVHQELGKLFDVETFYVAFQDGDDVHFEFHTEGGELQPKHTRHAINALTEYVIRTGQPLLLRNQVKRFKARMGLVSPGLPAMCYCAVPINLNNKAAGVIAAMNRDREFVYDERDLQLLQTAAGQLAVAIDNARLLSQEQQRAHYLEFLNAVSKRAISSQDAEIMLAEIVGEIQKHFNFDHIGIGVVDYATKEIVIKAEAGTSSSAVGKRLPLGSGVVGRVARTNEMVLMQDASLAAHLMGVLPDARSVLCIPLTYGETLLGVLNVESRHDNSFPPQEVLALNTFADLLSTALHNALVFQKMQQQSITDGLTGIKTRRFFLEALQAEWKRASRNGRPFSVVMIDMDRFKEVNDTSGHLEGDLVLARVARVLEQKCRHSNVVARYGGDEFIILMPDTNLEQAEVLAERLRIWMQGDPMLSEWKITGSFGLATYPLHGITAEQVLRVADRGMYAAKHAGGNRVAVAAESSEPESAAAKRQLLAAYVEGFVRREETGPGSVEELVTTLQKLCSEGGDAEALKDAIAALAHAAETREVHAAGHGEFAARHAEAIARDIGLSAAEIAELGYAARVHDVGKIVIPERVLTKATPLTAEEQTLLRIHPTVGGQICSTIPGGEVISMIVQHHHERMDGTGYPDGLQRDEIPLGARILAVADAYVDMTTERPYAPAMTSTEALERLETNSQQFDQALVNRFKKLLLLAQPTARSAD